MGSTTRAGERPTFASRCSLSVVDLIRSRTASSSNGADALFRSVLWGERGRTLRAGLASQHRGRSPEEIEEAIQIACWRFVARAEQISAPGQVYVWIRSGRPLKRIAMPQNWVSAFGMVGAARSKPAP